MDFAAFHHRKNTMTRQAPNSKPLRDRILEGEFDPPKDEPHLNFQKFLDREMLGFEQLVDTHKNLSLEIKRREGIAHTKLKEATDLRHKEARARRAAFREACFEDVGMSLEDEAAARAWEMAKDRGDSRLNVLNHFEEVCELIKLARKQKS